MQMETEQTAMLVIYDFDCTLTKRHSRGEIYQQTFEKPYEANLRAFSNLQRHIQQLQSVAYPNLIFGIATFGQYRERIINSCQALGLNEESVFICARYLAREQAAVQGKNAHIAELLQQHYERSPTIRITRVLLCDDDYTNIDVLRNYQHFVRTTAPWNTDDRYRVPVEGMLAPTPILLTKMQVDEEGLSRKVLVRKMDENLNTKVTCESPESEQRFLRFLNAIESKVAAVGVAQKFSALREPCCFFQRPRLKALRTALSQSFDVSLLRAVARNAENLPDESTREGDATPGETCAKSFSKRETDKPLLNDRHRLIKSGP